MVEKIYDAKRRVLEYMDKELSKYGSDRMDVSEMDKLTDIVKDLSEAEKACWEAEYYRSVTDAMESSGYMPDGMGYDGRGGNRGNRGGSGYRDSMGRYSTRANRRRGYRIGHMDAIENIREELQSATAEERDQLKREVLQMFGM